MPTVAFSPMVPLFSISPPEAKPPASVLPPLISFSPVIEAYSLFVSVPVTVSLESFVESKATKAFSDSEAPVLLKSPSISAMTIPVILPSFVKLLSASSLESVPATLVKVIVPSFVEASVVVSVFTVSIVASLPLLLSAFALISPSVR